MTAPTPANQPVQQMEFIITEDQVKTIGEITNNKRIMDILRSRPAPSADALSEIMKELDKVMKEKDEYIEKQENDEMSSEDWESWDILCGWERGLQFAESKLHKQHPNGKQDGEQG